MRLEMYSKNTLSGITVVSLIMLGVRWRYLLNYNPIISSMIALSIMNFIVYTMTHSWCEEEQSRAERGGEQLISCTKQRCFLLYLSFPTTFFLGTDFAAP